MVWQWSPPFLPMRSLRYPRDHCPQLARLTWSPPAAVPDERAPFIDRELYAFLVAEQGRRLSVKGSKRKVLRNTTGCRKLVIPPEATVSFGYGLDQREIGDERMQVRFAATAREVGSESTTRLLEDVVRSDSRELWRKATASLEDYAYRSIELCLDAQIGVAARGALPARAIVWGPPKVASPYREASARRREPTERERQLEEKQLRAIGYVQ